MRFINKIIMHCSATDPNWMAGRPLEDQVAEIRRWHVKERGWRDIGYHWIVGRDGRVLPGRREAVPGAHCRGHNQNSIGVCLIGGEGSHETDAPEQHFTSIQLEAARNLVEKIEDRYPAAVVCGHNEFAAKACPGFNAREWLGEDRAIGDSAPQIPRSVEAAPARSGTNWAATGIGTIGTGLTVLSELSLPVQIILALGIVGLAGFLIWTQIKGSREAHEIRTSL